MAAIVISGIMLKKTKMFAGDPAPFVMELPAYHVPSVGNVLRGTWERGWSFIKRAGTVILISSIVLWFLQGYGSVNGKFGNVEELYEDETVATEEYKEAKAEQMGVPVEELSPMDDSVLADIATPVSTIFKPLGFGSWRPTVATVTGLIAKENVVGTFGVLYNYEAETEDDELDEEGSQIWTNVEDDFNKISGGYGKLAAFSFMLFNLLCAPCFAAMGAIKREMNNAKWTWFAIGYMCVFAYAIALIVWQLGRLFAGAPQIVGLIFALAVLAFMLYMVFRPYKEATKLASR